jgi:hypothetical protein
MKAETTYTCSEKNASGVRKPFSILTKPSSIRPTCPVSLNEAETAGDKLGCNSKSNEKQELMKELNQEAFHAARHCKIMGNIGSFSLRTRRLLALSQRLRPELGKHPLFLTL